MNQKRLAIAALAALALLALGLVLRGQRQPPAAASESGKPLFPGLLDRINEVAAMHVTTATGGYRIVRQEGGFGVAEKGGYPVEQGQVVKNVLAIAELKKLERKTADPARYAEIGVQDVPTPDSSTKIVSLRDASDKELAALVLGQTRTGRNSKSIFVRKVGDPQAWLVEGNLDLREDATAWLDKKILEVKRADVRAVRTQHPDGELVLVSKAKPEDSAFHVENVPPDRKLKYATVANGMGGALEYLNLQDVARADSFEPPEGEPVRTSFWTFDGLRIDVALYEKDSKTYASFRASYDAEGPAELAAVGPVLSEEPAEAPEGEAAPEKPRRPAEEVRAEAEKLDARLARWVFEIPAYSKTNLAKRNDELTEPLVPEEEGAQPGAAEDQAEGGEELDQAELERQLRELLGEEEGGEAEPVPAPEGPPEDEEPHEAQGGGGR